MGIFIALFSSYVLEEKIEASSFLVRDNSVGLVGGFCSSGLCKISKAARQKEWGGFNIYGMQNAFSDKTASVFIFILNYSMVKTLRIY